MSSERTDTELSVADCGANPMRFAYADPPYMGCCGLYEHHHPDGERPFDGKCWDDIDTQEALMWWLHETFPDGWAMSLSAVSLRYLLPLSPHESRVAPWVKPFASFKPNVNPAYTWEPVIYGGGRKRGREEPTAKDHVIANITLKKGFTGAKPPAFTRWILDLLGVRPDDEFVDLFPGSGAVTEAWEQWRRQTTIWGAA